MAKDIDDDAPLNLDDMQVFKEAIAGTEKEIFSEATGGTGEPLDESGDRSLEEMGDGLAGEHEPDDDAEEGADDAPVDQSEAKGDKDQSRADDGKFAKEEGKEGDKGDQPDRRVPLSELQKERAKRQEIEAARLADQEAFNKRFADLEARIAAPKEQPKAQAEQPKDERPDVFFDPVGAHAWDQRQMDRRVGELRAENSLRFASLKHGETFTKAYAEFQKLNPADPQQLQIGQSVAKAADPGEAMVAWFRQAEAQKRVGSDVDAFEKRVRDETRDALLKDPEFRKQIIADLHAEANGGLNGKPRTVVRLPSLNGASGSNSARNADPELLNNSDKSVFAYATGE